MSDVNCPYCGSSVEPEDLCDLDMDSRNHFQCLGCEKLFYIDAQTKYSVEKDCSLNAANHEWDRETPVGDDLVHCCRKCDEIKIIEPFEVRMRMEET